jgi:hypothetical protein
MSKKVTKEEGSVLDQPIVAAMNATLGDVRFTGIARSVECYNTNGQFRNFRIVTLHLEEGVVKKATRSDPYASFEAISRLELWNELAVINLNNNWSDGKALSR